MRLFVAVELPEAVRDVLRHGVGKLKRDLPDARWVRVEGMHLTLRFLGEQPDRFPAELEAAVAPVLGALPAAEVRLGGGGFFPGPRRPRVAWIGGQAAGLAAWAEAVECAAVALGTAPEPRPFSAHLTLARVEKPWGERAVEHFLIAAGKLVFPPFVAREAVLFRSELKPSGAEYTVLRRWPVAT